MLQPPIVLKQAARNEESRLHVIVIGAGLGGLGAAISILLAGHDVEVLESASQIGEVGAGIQVLPNSSRILISWGLREVLSKHATSARRCNILHWKGDLIADMDFGHYEKLIGTPFWDFHRADLHKALLDRAVELGVKLRVNARVLDVISAPDGRCATVVQEDGTRRTADLVVGADGLWSKCREIVLGHHDPPLLTGDLAYRLLLSTKEMMKDPELWTFFEKKEVNYWYGPDAHCVSYTLRGGELFNVVLCVPDDLPAHAKISEGSIEEMRALFKDWDPRLSKLIAYCQSVQKWRLCYRPDMRPSWSHPSGAFTCLGDAVHATLPYLASGAGMSLEDGAVLGHCLARLTSKSIVEKKIALQVYESCRSKRTEKIVARGNLQQHLNHLHDGAEQEARDARMHAFAAMEIEDSVVPAALPEGFVLGDDPLVWRQNGAGSWLLNYDAAADVDARWAEQQIERSDSCDKHVAGKNLQVSIMQQNHIACS